MTTLRSPIPRFHLAMPVNHLAAARKFDGGMLDRAGNAQEFRAFVDDSQMFAA